MSKIEVNGLITLNDAHVHQRRGVTASRTYRLERGSSQCSGYAAR